MFWKLGKFFDGVSKSFRKRHISALKDIEEGKHDLCDSYIEKINTLRGF